VIEMVDIVNIHDAKTHLSRLIAKVESGEEIVIARAGRPVARLVPLEIRTKRRPLGIWKGQIWISPDFDEPIPELLDAFEA
jgi:prevent-host-death family protein